jgi:hypothetical protein
VRSPADANVVPGAYTKCICEADDGGVERI